MKTFLKTTALTTFAVLANMHAAHAFSPTQAYTDIVSVVQETSFATTQRAPILKSNAKIGIARLDHGRLIAAPISEIRQWDSLNARTHHKFAVISPGAVLNNIPAIPMNGKDSLNKLDEIRMTASDLRMDYILIYGMGKDAQWGSFAGQSMMETGLIADTSTLSPGADTKALLVNTYTGQIYGTLTIDQTTASIGELTDKVQALITELAA